MKVEPYLFFNGRCDEALAFYQKALGAKVTMKMRFSESPDPKACQPGIDPNKVMHANMTIGDTQVMASDGMGNGTPHFEGFSLTIAVKDAGQAEKYFAALSDGGQVQMPLAETFFSPKFGMVADKFGVSWMILTEQ